MLRFFDGFDHYALGDLIGGKWTTGGFAGTGGGASAITSTNTRTGAGALKLGGTASQGDWINLTWGTQAATVTCGFGLYHNGGTGNFFLVFGDASTFPVGCQIGFGLRASGVIELHLNAGGMTIGEAFGTASLVATTLNALPSNQWNYLEAKVTISNTVGAVELRVNGSNVGWFNLTGLDTQKTANAYTSVMGLAGGMGATGNYVIYDDFYLVDTVAGDGITSFLGPQKVATVIASAGNGTYTDFTPSSGTNHGALVDEATPNGDTDYVSSLTVGHRDSFNFPALGVTGVVNAVQAVQWAKISTSGARSINSFARIGSTDFDHATPTALDTSYRAARAIWTTSPATTGAWTVTEIDGAEFGARVQA